MEKAMKIKKVGTPDLEEVFSDTFQSQELSLSDRNYLFRKLP